MSNKLLSRNEAAEFLGVKPGTLATWACCYPTKYQLPYVKIGRLVKYKMTDLIDFLEKNTKLLEKDE